ncbi:hypothetical protein [uncultured Ruminococcus sp.]|uniref:hypothetical protein n=1 Tax=uncultured Ruminococcus sp. TaxID=165186 RepID=UPI0025CD9A7E|nr:hypothetical protein [uncultured Ruminococcus sp.]
MKIKFFAPILAAVMLTASCGVSVGEVTLEDNKSAENSAAADGNNEANAEKTDEGGASAEQSAESEGQSAEAEKPQSLPARATT